MKQMDSSVINSLNIMGNYITRILSYKNIGRGSGGREPLS